MRIVIKEKVISNDQNQGKDDFWILKLSAETTNTHTPGLPSGAMQLWPSPATDYINILAPGPYERLDVQVSDSQGRAVLQQSLSNGAALSVSMLPAGMYVLSARTGDRTVFWGKFEKM